MSSLLWTAFLQSIGEIAVPVLLACPPGAVVSTDPGQCYATGVALGAPSVSGGCQTPGVTNDAPVQFPKGATLVHWTATDSCGNSATCSQNVLVVDRELPRIACSTNRVTAATTSSGATVVFPAAAVSDNCPEVSVTCIPPSGSTFRIGTNTVRCTAVDAASNRATCSFTVRVKGAAEQMRDLIFLVGGFHLEQGTENSFTSQLRSALAALASGDKTAAVSFLQIFIDHVNAQSGKKLTVAQASSLVAAAKRIKTVIQGSFAAKTFSQR